MGGALSASEGKVNDAADEILSLDIVTGDASSVIRVVDQARLNPCATKQRSL